LFNKNKNNNGPKDNKNEVLAKQQYMYYTEYNSRYTRRNYGNATLGVSGMEGQHTKHKKEKKRKTRKITVVHIHYLDCFQIYRQGVTTEDKVLND
jgi:hypothetical protein